MNNDYYCHCGEFKESYTTECEECMKLKETLTHQCGSEGVGMQ